MFHEMKEIKERAAARAKRDKKKLKQRRMKAKARQIMGGETGVDLVDDVELFNLKEVRGRGAVDKLVNDQVRTMPWLAWLLESTPSPISHSQLVARLRIVTDWQQPRTLAKYSCV